MWSYLSGFLGAMRQKRETIKSERDSRLKEEHICVDVPYFGIFVPTRDGTRMLIAENCKKDHSMNRIKEIRFHSTYNWEKICATPPLY